jgi:branched-chain amino acid transport system substrate-binding protein
MGGSKRLHGRKLALAVGIFTAAATSMGASSCGATSSSTITVTGNTLTVYASAPTGTPGAQDLVDAERLALRESGAKAGKFQIRFIVLHGSPSDNARTAIQDTSAIAYLGENDPGSSADSMGILEDQDLLQVTPADTAIELTRSTPAVPGAPNNLYESFSTYGRTLARVVPSGLAEARAQAAEMHALGVGKLYVADDGTEYGKAIAYAVEQAARQAGINVTQTTPTAGTLTGTDGVFVGASSAHAALAEHLFGEAGGNAKLFAPSALAGAALPNGTYVSQPGFLSKDLPSAARTQFVKPFASAYGHTPATEAIFGYEAMSAVLGVIGEAGSKANDRATVVHDFFSIKDRASVLGTYSIDSDGDTSIAPFVISRSSSGVLRPYKFLQASG